LRQTGGTALAHQHPGLHQRADALLQERGVPLGPRNQELGEGRQTGIVSQSCLQEFVRLHRRQRVQPHLRVVGLRTPSVPIFGAIVDQQQQAGHGQALDQAVKQGLRLGVDPVEILEDQRAGCP
jgi:hypothetical protein